MHHLFIRFALAWTTTLAVAVLQAQTIDERLPVMAPVLNDPVQGGWRTADLERQALEFEQLAGSAEGSARSLMLMNAFRSERNAALARNSGTITARDRQRLHLLAEELERLAPGSFEAYLTRYYLEFPEAGAFMQLARAKAKDATRPELLGPLLGDAARGGLKDDMELYAKAFKARGAADPALWKVAEDILLSVEHGGVLFAAGDMDALPVLARQYADGRRQDVLVVDVRLLVDPAYRHRMWDLAKARGKVPGGASEFLSALPLATARPVHYSLALGAEPLRDLRSDLYVTGLAFRHARDKLNNLPILEKRWDQMHKETGAGPLARNYLLPGSVLLQHYRRVGNEERATVLEHELRRMARTMGATPALYSLGVLEH